MNATNYKDRLKAVCAALGGMFMMAGISLGIGVCDYYGRNVIDLPWVSFWIVIAIIFCATGVWFGIMGCQD